MADPVSALSKMSPRAVSLFSGAGGMDLGFVRAGFEVVWANDVCADACSTHRRNLGPHVVCEDVRVIDPRVLPGCDVVIGGPPCQGFSVAGKMAPEDPRSALIWEFVRLVKALRPSAFVLENVKALATLPRWTTVRSRLFGALVELAEVHGGPWLGEAGWRCCPLPLPQLGSSGPVARRVQPGNKRQTGRQCAKFCALGRPACV